MHLLQAFRDAFDPARVLADEPMARHTTMRVGGTADVFFTPISGAELALALSLAESLGAPVQLVGRGSNLIVRDGGLRGLTLCLDEHFGKITVAENRITAEAGALLAQVGNAALKCGLTGFEFASGIPGTVGGGAAMNAGAYGGELSQVLLSAHVYLDGKMTELSVSEMDYGYRTSRVLRGGGVVLAATFALSPAPASEILARMNDLSQRRRDKQPLSYPSAGSVFKRPEGHFAGALIEQAGLKGLQIGGARVSEKHAGFIVNTGEATARDVLRLIAEIQARVYEDAGVRIEPEVRIVGED